MFCFASISLSRMKRRVEIKLERKKSIWVYSPAISYIFRKNKTLSDLRTQIVWIPRSLTSPYLKASSWFRLMFAVGFNPHFSWFPIILNFQKIFWSEFVLFYRPVGKGGTDFTFIAIKKYEFSIFFKKLAHFYPSFRKEKRKPP